MYNNFKDTQTTRAIINLDNIAHNYLYTCGNTSSKVICVIKSDAYGHGAVKVAKRLLKEGADFFAVATIDEAMELYENKIEAKILILGFVPDELIQTAVDNGFSICVHSLESAKQIANLQTDKQINVHIKLNTGMNRLGFNVFHEDYAKLTECIDILKINSNIKFIFFDIFLSLFLRFI
jgi:alanine racemase